MAHEPQFQGRIGEFHGHIGDTASILLTMFGPKQQDWHVVQWRVWRKDRKLAADVAKVNENMRLGRSKWEGV